MPNKLEGYPSTTLATATFFQKNEPFLSHSNIMQHFAATVPQDHHHRPTGATGPQEGRGGLQTHSCHRCHRCHRATGLSQTHRHRTTANPQLPQGHRTTTDPQLPQDHRGGEGGGGGGERGGDQPLTIYIYIYIYV